MSTTSRERAKLGYGLREEEGEDFWLFGALTTIKISAEDTAGQYCVIDAEVPPGVGSPGTSTTMRTSGSSSTRASARSTSATRT